MIALMLWLAKCCRCLICQETCKQVNEPRSEVEFLLRYADNHSTEGELTAAGVRVVSRIPCPFCAAPNFLVYTLADVLLRTLEECICSECGRGAKFYADDEVNGLYFRPIQSRGPNPPEWMGNRIERLS